MNLKIEELGLRSQTLLYLKRHGINDISQILDWEIGDFLKVRNLGYKRFSEIRDKIDKLGDK